MSEKPLKVVVPETPSFYVRANEDSFQKVAAAVDALSVEALEKINPKHQIGIGTANLGTNYSSLLRWIQSSSIFTEDDKEAAKNYKMSMVFHETDDDKGASAFVRLLIPGIDQLLLTRLGSELGLLRTGPGAAVPDPGTSGHKARSELNKKPNTGPPPHHLKAQSSGEAAVKRGGSTDEAEKGGQSRSPAPRHEAKKTPKKSPKPQPPKHQVFNIQPSTEKAKKEKNKGDNKEQGRERDQSRERKGD